MKLPLEWFINMTEKTDGFSMESLRLPDDFESCFEHNATRQSNVSCVPAVTPNFVEENVLSSGATTTIVLPTSNYKWHWMRGESKSATSLVVEVKRATAS